MRTIKFRVWDKAINKMVTQENVKEFLDKTISKKWEDEFPYSSDEWYPAYEILTIFDYLKEFQERTIKRYEPSENRFDIMQYTGLHDENGKEIYEGDIIEFSYDMFVGNFDTFVAKGKVVFEEGAFYVEAFENERTTEGEAYLLYSINLDTIEVIGNIYENKELLNETNR